MSPKRDIITEAICDYIQEGHRHIKHVPASSFGHGEADDDYLYHVTSTEHVPSIKKSGLHPGHTATVTNYAGHSKGKIFLTDRSGVSYWKDRIEQHLFHNSDNPRQVAVFRVHKSHVKDLQPDPVGTEDARANAYYTTKPIFPKAKKSKSDIIAEAIESLFEAKASHVGNCVKSFDRSSGDCVVPHLPYRDVSHFAVGEEGAKKISKAEFEQAADIPKDLHKLHSRPDTEYLHDEDHDVHMMYDPKKDVHHFFTKVKL